MDKTEQTLDRLDRNDFLPSLVGFILVSFEVLLVAVLGLVLVQLALAAAHFSSDRIMSDSRIVFTVLTTEASVTLLIILTLLHFRNESLKGLGCIWKNAERESLLGLTVVPFLFASTFAVSMFFQLVLPSYVTTTNSLLDLVKERGDLTLFIISSIYVGGVKEEIQRAFVLNRFERYVGRFLLKLPYSLLYPGQDVSQNAGRRAGVTIGLALWSFFFAWGHTIQGIDNAVGAGVLGLLFGLLYIWRRNLIAPMLAHALYNIITLIAFWMSSGS